MKRILLIFLIVFLTASTVFSMPDYDPAQRDMPVVVYAVEEAKYNKELYERLIKEFHDKYTDSTGNYSPPINAYAVEVGQAFLEQRKMYNH